MSIYLVKLAHAHVEVIINYPYSIAQMCTWRYARPQFRHTLFDHKRKHKRKSQSYKLELIQPYTLVGPPVKRPVLALPAVYSSRTVYRYQLLLGPQIRVWTLENVTPRIAWFNYLATFWRQTLICSPPRVIGGAWTIWFSNSTKTEFKRFSATDFFPSFVNWKLRY